MQRHAWVHRAVSLFVTAVMVAGLAPGPSPVGVAHALPTRSARVPTGLASQVTATHNKPILFRGQAIAFRQGDGVPWPHLILGGISGLAAILMQSRSAKVGWTMLGGGLIGWGMWEWRAAPALQQR